MEVSVARPKTKLAIDSEAIRARGILDLCHAAAILSQEI